MPEATNSVQIHRPAEEVFAFLADGSNDRLWRQDVLDIHLRSGEGKGAVYEQGVKGPFGRRVAADYEIIRYEPNAASRSALSPGQSDPKAFTNSNPSTAAHE
jgi:hypothetical protein